MYQDSTKAQHSTARLAATNMRTPANANGPGTRDGLRAGAAASDRDNGMISAEDARAWRINSSADVSGQLRSLECSVPMSRLTRRNASTRSGERRTQAV